MLTITRGLPRIISMAAALGALLCLCACDDKKKADDGEGDESSSSRGGGAKDSPKKIVALDAGGLGTCALLADGTVRCWGGNREGALGIGKSEDDVLETYVPVQVTELEGAKKLWFGASYCWSGSYADYTTDTGCAQLADGTTKCWGHNGKMYGDGEGKNSDKPVAVAALKGALDVGSHCGTACAVLPDKSVSCWGSGAFGQIGNGTKDSQDKPTPVKGLTDAAEVDCGQNHCCARKNDGTVSCWGYNSSGQLGDGTTTQQSEPVAVGGLADATQLSLMLTTSCALKKDGSVVCWGSGFDKAPKAVPGATDVTQLDAEDALACALKKDGSVVCWGNNRYGQLGDGTTTDRPSKAEPVKGLSGVAAIGTGEDHACAVLKDNSVKCWGRNNRGQLGDATLKDSGAPVVAAMVGAEKLEPLAADKTPSALPTDGKTHTFAEPPPEGCTMDKALKYKVKGKDGELLVRHVVAEPASAAHGIVIRFYNFDFDAKDKYAMTRGQQLRAGFNLEHWVIEKVDDKERPVAKPLEKDQPYTTGTLSNFRLTFGAGIYDNQKQHSFDGGQVKLTRLDDKWVCGEIDLMHTKSGAALKGNFAVPRPPDKG